MNVITFDLSRAIGLCQASQLMRGKSGQRPAVETVRRWANPKRGCYPAGRSGPRLVLQTHKLNGEILTMPEWVAAFEADRVELSLRLIQPPSAVPPIRPATTKQRERD